MALRHDGFTTKGKSHVTEETGRGEARGEGMRARPVTEVPAVAISSVKFKLRRRQSRASTDAEGFSVAGARLKAGLEGLRWKETSSGS